MTRKEAYKHEQFKEGVPVTVVSNGVKVLEVRIGTPSKEETKK